MASYKINFTKTTVENITPPTKDLAKNGGVYDTYYDTNEKGLVLLVSHGGAKTFYLYQKIFGTPARIKLGHFPDLSIDQARKGAVKNRGIINSGVHPNEEKNRLKQDMTFGSVFEEYMTRYSKKHKRTWKSDESDINRLVSHWFNKKSSSISKQEIRLLLEKIRDENGPYQSNRLFEKIRAIYNKSIEWGWSGINPAIGIVN